MSGQKWEGEHLENLLHKNLEDLHVLYPDQSLDNLARRKREARQRGGVLEPNNRHPDRDRDGRLDSTWEMMHKNEDGEAEVTTLHKYVYSKNIQDTALRDWKPAEPANITPSKIKPIPRNHKILLVISDMQIEYRRNSTTMELHPVHSEESISAMVQLAKDLQPDEIINCGDTLDFASLSTHFERDSDHFYRTLAPSFQRIHDLYAQLRADTPTAKITEVDSNHNIRLRNFVLKYIPDMYNMRRPNDDSEYPVMTYPFLANLKHLDINWISGYGSAEYKYKPDLVFLHGTFAVSNGSTANKLSKINYDRNIIQGHKHSMELHYRTDRLGQQLCAGVVGALCKTTGEVSSYHSSIDDNDNVVHYQEDWQNGIMVIRDYGNGHYQFDQVPINFGIIKYNGKEYSGNS